MPGRTRRAGRSAPTRPEERGAVHHTHRPGIIQGLSQPVLVAGSAGFGRRNQVSPKAETDRVGNGKYVTRQAARCRIGRSHPTRTTGAAYGTDLGGAAGGPR